MSEKVAGFAAALAIRLLIRTLKKRKQLREEKAPPQLTKDQIDQYITDATIEEAYEALQQEYDRSYQKLLQKEEKIKDPYIKAIIQNLKEYHKLFRPDNEMHPAWMLTAILLNEALEKGITDRYKIYQYILRSSWEFTKQLAHLTPQKPYTNPNKKYPRTDWVDSIRNPYMTLVEIESMISEALREKKMTDPEWEKHRNVLNKYWSKIKSKLGEERKTHHKIAKHIETLEEKLREAAREAGVEPFIDKTPEEILGLEEEEPIAPRILAEALLERLPSASYKTALITHLLKEGKITPQTALKYLETIHSPNTPQGTALYNIIHQLIDHYEEQVAKDAEPDPPSEAIKTILHKAGIPEWQDPTETLQEAEEQRIHPTWINTKIMLGIPLPPSKAARSLRNLIQKLQQIETGKANPEELDTILELATLAQSINAEPHPSGPGPLKRRTLNPQLWHETIDLLLRKFHNQAVQLGREEDAKLIREMTKIIEEHLKTTNPTTPYYKIIAQAIRKVRSQLLQKGYPEKDALWAANLAQHILTVLPLRAANPGEEPRIKALLTEGYQPTEHEVPLLVRGLNHFYNQLKQAKTKEEKEAILARLRDSMNTLEALKSSIHRTVQSIKQDKTENPRLIGEALHRTIRSISRAMR